MKKDKDIERQFPLEDLLKQSDAKLDANVTNKMLDGIRKSYQPKPVPIYKYLWKYSAVAACMLGIVAITANLFSKKTDPGSQIQSAKIQPKDTLQAAIVFANLTDSVLKKKLPDGSTVKIYPNSSIEYLPAFESDKRDVHLQGKALFSVAKDAGRPFTVYCAAMSVTALGTSFLVSDTKVKLIDGKIKVSALNGSSQTVLLPGEQLRLTNGHLAKDAPKNDIKEKKKIKPGDSRILSFKNHRLKEVFTRIENRFSVVIKDESDKNLSNKLFTGKFLEEDNVDFILKAICSLYGTQYRIEGTTVFIFNQ